MKNLTQKWVLSLFSHKISLKVKLTAYLFIITLFQIKASTTYSQNTKVTLNLNTVTYHDVFRAIESQTEYNVLYNHNDINHNEKVSVNVKNTLVFDVLNKIFTNTNIHYKTIGKQIILIKKDSPLTIKKLEQSKIKITGNVKNTNGEPILGVNVLEQGTNNGVITDFDGNYSITVSNKNAVLLFSFVGYTEKEILINNQTTLNITLEENISELDAVVLVGYGTVKKSDITGSLSSISTEAINKTQSTSIAQAIQGRTTGVTVTKSSGQPGSTPTVRIRGIGTVNNANPLYVVDGIPINDITNINMADAESIEVLKDASATAIYGSRGANGVILITTKKGNKSKPVISYSTYFGFEDRIDNLKVMNAKQWATIYNEGLANDGRAADPALENPNSLPNYNWKDAIYRTGKIENHQLSVSGSTDKTSYYLSFGHIEQEGIIKKTSFKRTNFRVNNTYQIKPKVKIGHNIQYAKTKSRATSSFGQNSNNKTALLGYVADPISPIYDENGKLTRPTYSTEIRNPLGFVNYNQVPLDKESFLGSLFLDANISKNLTFKSNFGLEINHRDFDNFLPEYFISLDQERTVNQYSVSRAKNKVLLWSNTLNYSKTFNKKHTVNALLGHEFQKLSSDRINASRSDIPDIVGIPTISAGDVTTALATGTNSESALLSFFGRLNYNYDNKYLLTGTYRRDESSRFSELYRTAYFPSLAFAWNAHNESFYDLDFINQLKFRAGWGETGNQNIPNDATFDTLDSNQNYVFGNNETSGIGIAPLRPGNPDLKWETTITTNFGLDLAFLQNSITLTADYFVKTTSDLLYEPPVLNTSGASQNPTVNTGEIQNKGLELSLNYKKRVNDFFFSVGGNISVIKNEVKSLSTANDFITVGNAGNGIQGISRTETGQPLASFYGLKVIGLFQNQAEIDNNASLSGNLPGDVRYEDLNEDGVINDDDRTFIGSPLPDFSYGINLDMSYKQFDLSMFFQGTHGNDIFDATSLLLDGQLQSNLRTSYLGRWTGEGTSNTIPRASFDSYSNNNKSSSRFVKDGSYLRLKNIQIGYNLPDEVLNKISLSKARVYVAAQNLLTFTNYDGLDPELGIDQTQNGRNTLDIGIDRGRYPSSKTVSLGLDIKF